MGQQDHQAQQEAQEQDRIDAMQGSLTRLHDDIGEQRQSLEEGQRDVTQRQRDVVQQERDLAVSERFEEDLQQNLDRAQHRQEQAHHDGNAPAAP